jgi:IclR family acetate operon transcriptional repressor
VREREHDLSAIAAPVWSGRAELAAILGVQGPASRFERRARRSALAPLLERADAISRALGWSGSAVAARARAIR